MLHVGLDAAPFSGPPCGVRRMVEGWLAGAAAVADRIRITPLFAASRRLLPKVAAAARIDVFLSPWAAFPRVDRPLVVTVHELPFVRWGPVEGRMRALAHRWWLRRAVRRAEALLVPSEATKRDLLSLHPDAAARVHVVPHAFDPAPWRAERDAAAGHPSDRRPLAVAVGAASRRKGLDVLADVARRLPEVRFVVVGAPPADLAARLRGAGVEVREGLDDAAVRALVASADLFVHPSLSEGFGFPVLEGMAAGLPVIATTGGSVPEVAGDAALLVSPGDAEALADAVRRVLRDADLRARLVAAGARRADAFPEGATARALAWVVEAAAAGGRP